MVEGWLDPNLFHSHSIHTPHSFPGSHLPFPLFSGWHSIVLRASILKFRDLHLLMALSLSSPSAEMERTTARLS